MTGVVRGAPPIPTTSSPLRELLRAPNGITALFQPIVDLETGEPVAVEALSRGPLDSDLEQPTRLLELARAEGCLAELDWACRAAAVESALDAGLPPDAPLFINVEPETINEPCPARFETTFALAQERLALVVELTERSLTARPAELLREVARLRRRGWSIALDDVGADPRSLALLPLLAPDVIKLDLRLVQNRPSTEIAAVVNAVAAESERTGAVVVAEGLERPEHVDTARALGATLGQGWLFGLPARRPQVPAAPGAGVALPASAWHPPDGTPYEIVSARRDVRRSTKPLLIAMSRHLEEQARGLGASGVVLGAFQDARHFSGATRREYEQLARGAAFVAALGAGMEPDPAPGVRGGHLGPSDPLLDEWSVVVLGPHFAAALTAVDLGDDGLDRERRFDFALTHDRALVVEAAGALMARIRPVYS